MAQNTHPPGRLIAIDGSRGADVSKTATLLIAELQKRGISCAVSRWDASGLFGELAQTSERESVSMRTLSLVYAADLAFRLRWEIQPALAAGSVVIAAPYVETTIALGSAWGLPNQWLRELLRFAPVPDLQGLATERKLDRAWTPRFDRGYAEYCVALSPASAPSTFSKKARARVIAALGNARRRRVSRLAGSGLTTAVNAVTNSRPAGSSPPSSRLRTARR